MGLAVLLVREFRAGIPDAMSEFQQIDAVEEQVLKAYNDAANRSREGQLTDPEFLQVLERDVLPPWRSARQRLDRVRVPSAGEAFLQQFRQYWQLREQAWELLCRALRENDPGAAAESQQKMEEANRLVEKMKASSGGRKP
jgi:hypothetical protein